MEKIPCEMIRDLFPSYIDKLTSDATNTLIEEHIAGCTECGDILKAMQTPEAEPPAVIKEQKKEIDFLKKNKRRNLKIIIGSISAAVLLVCTILLSRAFVFGDYLYGDWIACKVDVDGSHIVIEGTSVDSAHGISKVTFEEENGIVTVTTKAVITSFLHSGDFRAEYTAKEQVRQVRINDRILWDDGDEISSLVSAVYETRHDFMGDMPANNQTANALNISGYLGGFQNELSTSARPYVWKLRLVDGVSESARTVMESDMESFGYILLGVIGNLDEVQYEYEVGGETVIKTVKAEDATRFLGQDIKNCGTSVRLLNSLINKTGLDSYAIGSVSNSDNGHAIMFEIVNFTESEIQSINVSMYNNGVDYGSFATSNSRYFPMKKGDSFGGGFAVDDFSYENFKDDVTGNELTLKFTIKTTDGMEYKIQEKIRVPSQYGTTTTLKICGSAEDGFTIVQ